MTALLSVMSSKKKFLSIGILFFLADIATAGQNIWHASKWSVSGYLNAVIQAPNHQPTTMGIDDLSLFVSGHASWWLNPFVEAEMFSTPLWESGRGLKFNQAKFVIERLYNDVQITSEDTLRIGKFLSPLSRWNQIHAAPLVWTTNRPITTDYSFSKYITGFLYRHDIDAFSGQSLQFYGQPYQEFDSKPLKQQLRYYQYSIGASWILQDDLEHYYSLGVQHDTVRNSSETRTSWSFNGFVQFSDIEIETELIYTLLGNRPSPQKHSQDWGGYLQLIKPIAYNVNFVTRYEHFEFSDRDLASDSVLGGLVYRPQPKISLKLEWQQTWGSRWHNESGLYSSIAILF